MPKHHIEYYPGFPRAILDLGVRRNVFLALSPLYSPRRTFALDLHVLAMPPAFNLSQDQTLQFCSLQNPPKRTLIDSKNLPDSRFLDRSHQPQTVGVGRWQTCRSFWTPHQLMQASRGEVLSELTSIGVTRMSKERPCCNGVPGIHAYIASCETRCSKHILAAISSTHLSKKAAPGRG